LQELQQEKINLEKVRILNNERVFLDDRAKIVQAIESEVKEYVNKRANIKEVK
jgi:hypothetical protein